MSAWTTFSVCELYLLNQVQINLIKVELQRNPSFDLADSPAHNLFPAFVQTFVLVFAIALTPEVANEVVIRPARINEKAVNSNVASSRGT